MGLGTTLLRKTEIFSASPAGVSAGGHTCGGSVSDFSRRRGIFIPSLHGVNCTLDQKKKKSGTQKEPKIRCLITPTRSEPQAVSIVRSIMDVLSLSALPLQGSLWHTQYHECALLGTPCAPMVSRETLAACGVSSGHCEDHDWQSINL